MARAGARTEPASEDTAMPPHPIDIDEPKLLRALDAVMPRVADLFDRTRAASAHRDAAATTAPATSPAPTSPADPASLDTHAAGVSRPPYSEAEQRVADLLTEHARDLHLECRVDAYGNGYYTLPGRDREAPGWLCGSHIDSVPRGGHYDGLAGVIAGLAAVAAMREAGAVPAVDVTVMAVRSEEASAWYAGVHGGHIGSRAALGLLPRGELDSAVDSRTGRTLAEQMRLAGFDPDAVGRGDPVLQAARWRGWLELHIEQGPVLETDGHPVGIVTAIRGATRARDCRALGEWTHSGAVPHELRHDALLGATALVQSLAREAAAARAAGDDLTFTVGRFGTEAAEHSITKVPGRVDFCLEFRSQSRAVMERMSALAHEQAAAVGSEWRMQFDLGTFSLQEPAPMCPRLQASMAEGARALGIDAVPIASGAGHDAQDFVHAGFPAAMIFVRNANGSHNPREAMDLDDFRLGTALLAWQLMR